MTCVTSSSPRPEWDPVPGTDTPGTTDEPVGAATSPSTTRVLAEGDDAGSPDGAEPSERPDAPSTHERLLVTLLGERALRLGATASDRLWGWLGPLIVAAVAGVLRFWNLGRPGTLVFDETYYVKQAYTLLVAGFDAAWPDDPNPSFESGNMDIWEDRADYVVHPPVGKWMMALGLRLGGPENPWAWRLATAVVGVLGVLILARVARRLFSSTLAGVVAGGLFAIDGVGIVHSRTGLLDSFVMFWGLVAFALIVADRFHARRRLAARAAALLDAGQGLGRFGPRLGVRWYRLAAAVALGLCIGTKWSGMYFLAAYCVLTVLWDASARRAVGITGWPVGTLVRDAIPAALTMVPLAAATYLASWTGWFRNDHSYMRTWAQENPTAGVKWLPESLRSLWQYHSQVWEFHNGLTTPHPYQAHPLGWLLQLRPTSFYYQQQSYGEGIPVGGTCRWEQCTQAVSSVGNPVLWWLATLALVATVVLVVRVKDWRGTAVLVGLVAGWLPWLGYAHRTIFTFYAIAFAPFMYLALAYAFAVTWEWSEHTTARRVMVRRAAIATAILVVAVSLFFYPIWTSMNVPTGFWRAHMWLRSWV